MLQKTLLGLLVVLSVLSSNRLLAQDDPSLACPSLKETIFAELNERFAAEQLPLPNSKEEGALKIELQFNAIENELGRCNPRYQDVMKNWVINDSLLIAKALQNEEFFNQLFKEPHKKLSTERSELNRQWNRQYYYIPAYAELGKSAGRIKKVVFDSYLLICLFQLNKEPNKILDESRWSIRADANEKDAPATLTVPIIWHRPPNLFEEHYVYADAAMYAVDGLFGALYDGVIPAHEPEHAISGRLN